MIKKVVIVLIVLNISYFVWLIMLGNSLYIQPKTYEEGVSKLTLLPTRKDKPSQNNCYAFGPFNSERSANIILEKITAYGIIKADVITMQTMQTLNYFVYLQPFDTREEALEVISEISKHEIRQYNLIESGTYNNAIGLGSFNNLDEARRHSEYVRFLGYDARYTTQKTRKEVYWVSYDEPAGENTPVFSWAKEINEKNNSQKIPTEC